MKIKKLFRLLAALVGVCLTTAFLTTPFHGWKNLKEESPYILIARCKNSPEHVRLVNGVAIDNPLPAGPMGGVILSDMEVVSVIKGGNTLKKSSANESVTLYSKYWPYQGENYLVFASDYNGTNCQALDAYRIISIGHFFQTNILVGKTLDDQIQILLHHRLDDLNKQIKEAHEEKDRLEELLKK